MSRSFCSKVEGMRLTRLLPVAAVLLALIAACGDDDGPSPSPTSSTPTATRTARPSPSVTASATPIPTTAPPTIHPGPPGQPLGFPIDTAAALGVVTGDTGSRIIEWGAGPDALSYTRDAQASTDAEAANRSGWDCRVHVEYEGQPAVDWYIPVGTAIFATMDGTATLYALTMANGFDYYSIPREPYLGNPDRSRASVNPFPGPSGGLGVYVEIDNGGFLTTSAHLDLVRTAAAVPAGAFYAGYSAVTDYAGQFDAIPDTRQGTPVAQWPVDRGDLIGYSGDAGYSEAPHLHYAIQRGGANALLCPTTEAGFDDGGWLLK